jgi:hypothetical protein
LSEFKRQIASGATVAVVIALALALGVGALLPGVTSNSSTVTFTQTSSTSTQSSSTQTSQTSSPPSSSSSTPTTTTQVTSQYSSATSSASTITSATTTTVTESTTVASTSTTILCSSGAQCGSFQIVSTTLVAFPGASSASNLTVTLANTGNVPIGSFEVFLNYNVNSSNLLSGVLPAGQEVTWSVSVQNVHFLVTSGETYSVLVEAFLIGAGHITANTWGSTEVLATPGG